MLRLIIIRHGDPDYDKDSLTELGRRQAQAVSKRLADEGIREIYTSSCGRTVETAQPTAELLGIPAVKVDFMREVAFGKEETPREHPRKIADAMMEKNINLLSYDFENDPVWRDSTIEAESRRVINGFDEWLAGLGYVREGNYYRVTAKEDNTVALFAHCGSTTVSMAHLFGLPYPFVFHLYLPACTAVTEIDFPGKEGDLSAPKLHILNDYRHIVGVGGENNKVDFPPMLDKKGRI